MGAKKEFAPGEVFVYTSGDRCEIGVVKRKNPGTPDGYFCWYHTGDTASLTHASDMHKIANGWAFKITRLDPEGCEREK